MKSDRSAAIDQAFDDMRDRVLSPSVKLVAMQVYEEGLTGAAVGPIATLGPARLTSLSYSNGKWTVEFETYER